ncbi:MAG TPA: hypothetical protein VGK67_05435 [Myxococcales bacterium]
MESFDTLSQRLDKLCRRERDHALALWVRQADRKAIDAAIETLASGDAHERRLRVLIAAFAGRESLVLSALGDPSLQVRGAAVAQAASRCQDGKALVAAARSSAPATRLGLAAKISRLRRQDLAQPLAEALIAQLDYRAARPLLEWCDEAFVRRQIEERGVGVVRWARMAARHPDLVLATLTRELEQASSDAAIWIAWGRLCTAVPTLARNRPQQVLDLWERFGPRASLHLVFEDSWSDLLRAAPERTVELACRALSANASQPVPRALLRGARALPEKSLTALARALAPSRDALASLLAELPPSRRAAVLAAALEGCETSKEIWSDRLLTVLPHEERHAAARRMLKLPEVQRDPQRALALTAWLPVEEALAALQAESKSAKGEDRARGWSLRLACIASNRRGLDETLQALLILKNEQDPVRLAAYDGLCRVPVSLFQPGHADHLLAFADFAVNARDTSSGTRMAVQRLAHRLLVAWAHEPASALFQAALRAMLELAEQRPVLAFPSFQHGLRRGAERALVDVLLPWFEKEVAREVNGNVLALAAALGRRARGHERLQKLLAEIVFTSIPSERWNSQRAAELWLDDPKQRDERVRKLLDWDESAVVLAPVWRHLHESRQDWLGPFIEGRVLSGRFASSKAGWLFPATDGFEAWLPRQQHVFARTLTAARKDKGQHAATRAHLVFVLARLPVTSAASLDSISRSPEIPMAEAALGALVWLDEPAAGLPILLDNLDGDRARVAMYAMPRLARLVTDASLLETLRGLLAREKIKVTVHKEVLRLLGSVQLPGVGDLLEHQWRREKLHRDVRVALLHAAGRRLDEEGSWRMFEAAAAHPERDLARAVLQLREEDVAPRFRERFAATALALGRHPSLEVRQALMEHFAQPVSWGLLVPEKAARLAAEALGSAQKDAPWPQAAKALASLACKAEALAVLEERMASLAAAAWKDPTEVPVDQEDLPAQRRLETLCSHLLGVPAGDRPRTRAAREAAFRALERVEVWLFEPRTALALADLPIAAAAVEPLRRLCERATTSLQGSQLCDQVARWGADAARAGTAEALLEIAAALAGEAPRESESWAALGLTAAAGQRFGWSVSARKALAVLRNRPETSARARRMGP